jgi:2-polyprenyl-3-methyl-5-hydroxy-6-metoxy-1,4-benzoquinol methylase
MIQKWLGIDRVGFRKILRGLLNRDWLLVGGKRSLTQDLNGSSEDARDQWIKDLVPGKSFVDVGGLWGTVNEKVTVAAKVGAASTTMLDITSLDRPLWRAFYERCASLGVSGCQSISANIDELGLEKKVGQFDVVHCSGVLYHCPNPLHTLTQLARISRKYLILTSTVIPSTVSNSKGTITVPPGAALFVPYLSQDQMAILKEHWERGGVSSAIGITEQPSTWRIEDYAPWWWLFPVATVRQLIMAVGFDVLEDCPCWEGKAHSFLARKRE